MTISETQRESAPLADPSRAHLPFIDGLRAIAIILVLGFHKLGPISIVVFSKGLNGWVGVDVFFVISGFLITSLLVSEQRARGTISLRNFYIRRWLRICPAYYFLLLVITPVLLNHLGSAAWTVLAIAGLYLSDFDISLNWGHIYDSGLDHTWSLSVEEQFYLLWPLCLKSLRGGFKLRAALIALSVLYVSRIFLILNGAHWLRLSNAFDTKVDSILIGCVAAFLLADERLRERARRILTQRMMLPLIAVAQVCSWSWLGHPAAGGTAEHLIFWCIQMPIENILTALLILGLCFAPTHAIGRALSTRPMVWIGKISYSLYLFHALTIKGVHSVLPANLNPFVTELLTFAACLLTAAGSYYIIERPFLKLKSKFAPTLPAASVQTA